MKSILYIFAMLSILLSLQTAIAQSGEDDQGAELIRKAMKDELKRSMDALALEDLERPCFLSYTISNARALSISATLGALIKSEQTPHRSHRVRVLVGDYQCNNENFMDKESGRLASLSGGGSIPIENDYAGIRRSLWKETDGQYKSAAEMLESKQSAMKQQNLSQEEEGLPDFTRTEPVRLQLDGPDFDLNKDRWEKTARELSAVFKNYHDIFTSRVAVFFYRGDAYHVNSEGTETKYPISIAALRVTAQTQADDGEPLLDHLLYYGVTPTDLPSAEQMKVEIKTMADQLVKLRQAPVFDDTYSGPLLFEDQAVAEVLAQRFFSDSPGLIASRKPIFSDMAFGLILGRMMGKSLEDKIDKKIMEDSLTVKAVPRLKEYEGQKLVGHFDVDAEGVIPPDELMLVEEGVLKTLLNGRTPTEKVRSSNGHNRYVLQFGRVDQGIGPGVIEVSTSEGSSKKGLKEQLIELAREEGLDYAIVIRKMESPNSGIEKEPNLSDIRSMIAGGGRQDQVTRPIYVYRVSLDDGSEQLLRTTELNGISLNDFKKIVAVSKESQLYDTLIDKNLLGFSLSNIASASFIPAGFSLMNGMPTSLIVPDAMLFEELELKQHQRAITKKTPVVENPVGI
jgi:hypothetical protein